MKFIASTAALVLALSAGTAFAQSPYGSPSGETLVTPHGPAFVTGPAGGVQTTIMPGGSTGIVTNYGNGTSSIITPNGQITTVPSAR